MLDLLHRAQKLEPFCMWVDLSRDIGGPRMGESKHLQIINRTDTALPRPYRENTKGVRSTFIVMLMQK